MTTYFNLYLLMLPAVIWRRLIIRSLKARAKAFFRKPTKAAQPLVLGSLIFPWIGTTVAVFLVFGFCTALANKPATAFFTTRRMPPFFWIFFLTFNTLRSLMKGFTKPSTSPSSFSAY